MKRPLLAITAMWMVSVAYAAFIGSTLVDGYRAAARGDVPLYTDFTPTYAASMLAQGIPTAVPFLAAIRTNVRGPAAQPFALSAPPVYFNVMYGQNGFLTAGLIGLASVKPHLGILIPLALIAGGYWRTFATATLTVIAGHVEFAVLGLLFAALLAVKWVATTFGIPIGATCVAVLLSLALNRFRHALNDQADTTALADVATRREPIPAAIATQ